MIAGIGLGLVAVVVTMLFMTTALVGMTRDDDWASFLSALPLVVLALGQGALVSRGAFRDPKNVPGFGVLLAVVPFAMFFEKGIQSAEGPIVLLVIAIVLAVLAAFGFLAGIIVHVIPALAWPLAWGMTASAFVLATAVLSIPMSWRFWVDQPPPSYAVSLPIKGELVADGPPVVVRGTSYRMKRDAGGGSLCQLVMTYEGYESSPLPVTLRCMPQKVRCDDQRHWCLVAQEGYAAGFTYDGRLIELRGYDGDDQGDVLLRICAELLAVVSAVLLWRHRERDRADRQVPSVSALVSASIGAALVIRILR